MFVFRGDGNVFVQSDDGEVEFIVALEAKPYYSQSEVDEVVTKVRNHITGGDGEEKMYSQEKLRRIIMAVVNNPTHRSK